MKRRWDVGIAFFLAVAALSWGAYAGWPWYATALAFVGFSAYGFFTLYEVKAVDPKYVAIVATLSAIAAVSRVVVQGIPGVQPATFFVILSGFSFGPATGAAVGAFTAIGSDFFLGEGGWTPWQMFAWGLAGATAGWLRQINPTLHTSWLVPFGFAWGFFFGWIMNTWSLLGGSGTVSLAAYGLLCIQSFWFDLAHALATSLFLLVAGSSVYRLLERFRRRLVITRE
jgi:energy-coupling factor transport system substrate-specific component